MGSESHNVTAVRLVMEAFNRRDVETVLTHAAADISFAPLVAEATGREEPFVGHEGLRLYFDLTGKLWDELVVEVEEIQEAGDAVVALGRVRGRGGGGRLDAAVIWAWKLRSGLIYDGRIHGDVAVTRAALGIDCE